MGRNRGGKRKKHKNGEAIREKKRKGSWICYCQVKLADAHQFNIYMQRFRISPSCDLCRPSSMTDAEIKNEPCKMKNKVLRKIRAEAMVASFRQVVDLEHKYECYLTSLLQGRKDRESRTTAVDRNPIKITSHIFTDSNIKSHDSNMCQDHSLDQELFRELLSKEEKAYGRYQEMLSFRKCLPAYKMKDDILNMVEQNQVSLVSGETGCGKTTQVAQFILDDYVKQKRGSMCHIVCTQPRRISAISVAERVACERDEKLGRSCGYIIRLEGVSPRKQGSILFCTIGVLLRFMIDDPHLRKVSHLIIDEIHERDTFSDFLLIIVKRLLELRPGLKVILMSATLNAKIFSEYFCNCPMLSIPGRTHPVDEYFLEDFLDCIHVQAPIQTAVPQNQTQKQIKQCKEKALKKAGSIADFSSYLSSIDGVCSKKVVDTLKGIDFDTAPYDLIINVVSYICETSQDGAILIFLPGWQDIIKLMARFKKNNTYSNNRSFVVVPIHSKLPSVSQKKVFEKPPPGCRKIVVGTNIVETSITIDDIVFVIDCGKAKEMSYDPELNISTLKNSWVSKASLTQRSGRAGRVQPGKCFRLFTKHHMASFKDYQIPEMMRTPLEKLCLQIKILKCGKIWPFLSKAVEPPAQKACEFAISELVKTGALDADENLTSLGYYLALLPVAPKIGRMILMGAIFSCLDPVLTVAASLESKDLFFTPMGMNKKVAEQKSVLVGDSKSDHIMLIRAVEGWEDLKGNHGEEVLYCRKHCLAKNVLHIIAGMKKQFARLLEGIGFMQSRDPKHPDCNHNSRNINLIKAVLCAGLYPNVAKVTPKFKRKGRGGVKTGKGGKEKVLISPDVINTGAQRNYYFVHPTSAVGNKLDSQSRWLIYHKIMKVERTIQLFDVTVISPYPLLFFGGLVRYNDVDTIEVDCGIKFHASPKTAKVIIELRKELDKLLSKKIDNPTMQIIAGQMNNSENENLLQAIIDLISSEKVQNKIAFDAAAAAASTSDDGGSYNEDDNDGDNDDDDDNDNDDDDDDADGGVDDDEGEGDHGDESGQDDGEDGVDGDDQETEMVNQFGESDGVTEDGSSLEDCNSFTYYETLGD